MGRGRSNAGSSYCPNCGEELRPSGNFCPSCGAERDGRASGPITDRDGQGNESITDRDVLEYRISKAMEAGWELEHDFGDHAVMIRRDVGTAGTHFLIALLTFWWTMGMGNALYAAYRYVASPERIVLRADQVDSSRARSRSDGETKALSWWGGAATAIVLWFGAAIAAAIAGAVNSLLWTVPFVLAAVAFALGGASVLPPVRRRLEDRRPVTANGWVRSVDERSVVDPDEPCTSCASPIRRGVERTYKKEFCLFGLPLSTSEGGTNRYCRRCANDDLAFSDPGIEPDANGRDDGRSLETGDDAERDLQAGPDAERDLEPD